MIYRIPSMIDTLTLQKTSILALSDGMTVCGGNGLSVKSRLHTPQTIEPSESDPLLSSLLIAETVTKCETITNR